MRTIISVQMSEIDELIQDHIKKKLKVKNVELSLTSKTTFLTYEITNRE